jgi:DNA primase
LPAFNDTDRETVRRAVDIVELISAYVPLKRVGARLRGLCPFHNEKTPSFYVNPAMQIFKCFGCGAGGDVFSFMMKREGLTFPEALNALAERAGVRLESRRREVRRPGEPSKADLYKVNDWAANLFSGWLRNDSACEPARRYLEKRGVSRESIDKFRLGAVPEEWDRLVKAAGRPGMKFDVSPAVLAIAGLAVARDNGSGHYDRFRNRVTFPIIDPLNRCLGFGGRTLGDDQAKYINTPETPVFSKGHGVFGLNVAKDAIQKSGRAVVVEGYMDCLMPHQHGVTNVVATLGTALTPDQVRLLRRYAQEVVLVFDSDAAGEKAADRALEVFLAEAVSVRVARVPSGKDPCDFCVTDGGPAFQKVIDDARPALEYKLEMVKARLGAAGNLEGRRAAAEEMLKAVSAGLEHVSDRVRRSMILADLSKASGVPLSDLHGRLNEIVKQRPPGPPSDRRAAAAAPIAPVPVGGAGDARTQAERTVLGLLLRFPEYFASVREVLSPQNFRDAALRRVAGELFKILEDEETFEAGALSAVFTAEPGSEAFVGLVADLVELGEEHAKPSRQFGEGGSVAAAIEQAVVCIRQDEQERMIAEELPRAATATDKPIEQNQEWVRLAARLQNRGRNPRARPKIAGGEP